MKISVCLDAVYRDRDIVSAMQEVRAMGIDTIEFWDWWKKDLDELENVLAETGLKISTFCTKFESLVDAKSHPMYLAGLKETIEVAKRFGVNRIISQVGNATDASRDEQYRNIINGLKLCLPYLESAGITLMLEPLNILVNHKGYYLSRSEEAFKIVEEIDSPWVKIIFDIYHQQITEGNLINNITKNIDKIAHFHAAGNPGRHELDKGEINYPEIFRCIDDLEYSGYMGLEYFPTDAPSVGLKKYMK